MTADPTTITALVAVAASLVATAVVARLGRVLLDGTPRAPGAVPGRDTAPPRSRRRWLSVRRLAPPGDVVVAEWCEQAARAVRGGHSLQRSLIEASRAVPAAGTAFAPVLHAVERGRRLTDALGDLDHDPSRPVGLAAQVLAACAELGGPAAAPLERTASTLHARAAERAERQAASAQARLSARVLTVLPVATLALLAVVEPDVRTAAVSPPGLTCLALGATTAAAGWWWMRRIIARAR